MSSDTKPDMQINTIFQLLHDIEILLQKLAVRKLNTRQRHQLTVIGDRLTAIEQARRDLQLSARKAVHADARRIMRAGRGWKQ